MDNDLIVTFAKKAPGSDDDEAGPGFGLVDKFSPSGTLLQRLIVGVPENPSSH